MVKSPYKVVFFYKIFFYFWFYYGVLFYLVGFVLRVLPFFFILNGFFEPELFFFITLFRDLILNWLTPPKPDLPPVVVELPTVVAKRASTGFPVWKIFRMVILLGAVGGLGVFTGIWLWWPGGRNIQWLLE
jgi:hypothetical protein